MIKILEENKEIFRDEENKCIKVTATINAASFVMMSDRDKHSLFFDAKPITFEGIARLKEGDADNEVEAIRIAESKMERNYYKYIKRSQIYLIKETEAFSERIKKSLAKSEMNISKANSHIEEICSRL